MNQTPLHGLLLIDKPKGWTSFDVVAKVRGAIRAYNKSHDIAQRTKVGHTGTLDPLATGLLVLAIGSYTKKVPELTKQDKSYTVAVTLGYTSTTDDAEGDLTHVSSSRPTEQQVGDALQSFVGTIQQLPPQFSAIKVDGKRAYAAARQGKTVDLKPRTVQIYSITAVAYAYPVVHCTVSVGSGTYIRSLARDVGNILGTGAYVSDLRRITVGPYSIENAQQVADFDPNTVQLLA